MHAVIVLGTAGSGKTTFTANFSRWLRDKLAVVRVCPVNLDPGASNLPYEPSYDVRTLVRVDRLMIEEGLGPNGALVRAAELIAERSDDIASSLTSLSCEYFVIDTPGQVEVFALRPTGRVLCDKLAKSFRLSAIWLGDYEPGRELEDLLSSALLAKIIELKLSIKAIPVLNKSDLWEGDRIDALWEAVLKGELNLIEGSLSGTYMEALYELINAVSSFRSPVRVASISAKYFRGFQDVFDMLNEVWCACGDLT